jgi:hypothetical protein
MKKPTLDEIKAIDLSGLYKYAKDNDDNRRLLRGEAGIEHYKLLAWFSNQFNNVVLMEVGTLGGLGTIALSYNQNNIVRSFDIKNYKWGNETPHNAQKNLVYVDFVKDVTPDAPFIFYDTSHNGEDEKWFFKELVKNKWKGVLVLDDIYLNQEMKDFWDWIPKKYEKEDWTDLGHATGTGIVYFK